MSCGEANVERTCTKQSIPGTHFRKATSLGWPPTRMNATRKPRIALHVSRIISRRVITFDPRGHGSWERPRLHFANAFITSCSFEAPHLVCGHWFRGLCDEGHYSMKGMQGKHDVSPASRNQDQPSVPSRLCSFATNMPIWTAC